MPEEIDNQEERKALRRAVEKNRLEMRRAWFQTESMNGALQSAKEIQDKITDSRPDNPDIS